MKPSFILDCSMTMAWCFADESTPEVIQIQERLAAEAALVPAHWILEVTNVLAMAEKRKRLSSEDSIQFVKLLSVLDIQIDEESSRRPLGYLLPFCRTYNLTSYDAVYLDLVLKEKLPLASLDDDLRKAAISLGVQVLGK
ncbi:type II toxin-antitoxin system VapC family toxin [soil metagenome]